MGIGAVDTADQVFIVDDDPGMRRSLASVMASASLPAQTFESAEAFLASLELEDEPRGCLVLDLRMAGMSGLQLQDRLRAQDVNLPIIFLTGYGDVSGAVRAIKTGAFDYLEKPTDPARLVDRVRAALETAQRNHQRDTDLRMIRQRLKTLSPREREVLNLVVQGMTNNQIAEALKISVKTVATHRQELKRKTGSANAADLSRMATLATF